VAVEDTKRRDYVGDAELAVGVFEVLSTAARAEVEGHGLAVRPIPTGLKISCWRGVRVLAAGEPARTAGNTVSRLDDDPRLEDHSLHHLPAPTDRRPAHPFSKRVTGGDISPRTDASRFGGTQQLSLGVPGIPLGRLRVFPYELGGPAGHDGEEMKPGLIEGL
jgi:hypothetical protein